MTALRLLALLSLAIVLSGQTESARPPVLGKLVDVDGRRVHIYCTGQGSPAVVVTSGGFSFDWGLVQPNIAQVTRICTYDPAGTAWSDPPPPQITPNCNTRVTELHGLLESSGVSGPYVLVGFSIGGLVARLYAARYPNEVSGMALVDHAFIETGENAGPKVQGSIATSGLDSPPVLISKVPISLDMEDDENFRKLPERDRELHHWARSVSARSTPEMAAVCFSEVQNAEHKIPFPLGNKPVAVVSTLYDSPRYRELQRKLLALSGNSRQFIAENSSHMVIIDQPEIAVKAIRYVIATARSVRR